MNHGDITNAFMADLNIRIESIINAKSRRRKPYYLLITIKKGYNGPLALGNNNALLHGIDNNEVRARGETRDMDLSGLTVGHVTIQVLEPYQVPNVPLISNILMKVDNKTGIIERLYTLPPDIPIVDDGNSVESESVAKSAVGMPIVYGAN